MIKFNGKKTGIFAAGVLFGTAGIKVLTSKDAKKLYTNCTQSRRMLKTFMQKHSRSMKTEKQLKK